MAIGSMKFITLLSIICLVFLALPATLGAQGSVDNDVLTNQGVVDLVKAKVGESVIINMIQTLPTRFSLNKNEIIHLKQQGVSDKILAAMTARGSSTNATASNAPGAVQHQALSAQALSAGERMASSGPVGTWEIRDEKDPMTDREFYEAHVLAKNDPREKVEVDATCESSAGGDVPSPTQAFFDEMKELGAPMGKPSAQVKTLPPVEVMSFKLTYVAKTGQRLARITTPMTGTVDRAPELLGAPIGDDTVTLRGGQSCVFVTMRLGDMYYQSVKAGCGDRDILALSFSSYDPKATDFIGSKNIRDSTLGSLLNLYARGKIVGDRGYDATLQDVLHADKFLLGLPLSDGSTSVVPIAITGPSFKQFASRCAADFARLAPAGTPTAAQPKPLPSLVRPGTTVSAWAKAMMSPAKFTGTADQFAAAFPGFLQQAAAAAGYDPQAFAKESAFVIDSVRTCAQITPAMGAQATSPMPGHRVVTRMLGQQYAICQTGGGSEANAKYPDTRIAVQVNSNSGENWKLGKGFSVLVFFSREKEGGYPIIFGTIPGPS
jgi:hypothetical protein